MCGSDPTKDGVLVFSMITVVGTIGHLWRRFHAIIITIDMITRMWNGDMQHMSMCGRGGSPAPPDPGVPMRRSRSAVPKVGVALAALLLVAAVSCGSDSEGKADSKKGSNAAPPSTEKLADDDPLAPQPLPEVVKLVATTPAMLEFAAPMLLAAEYGEFEKENLDVDIQITYTAMQALATGQADAAQSAPDAAWMNGIASDLNVRWVAGNYLPPENSTSGLWVRKDKVAGPEEIENLKGLKIASSQTSGVATYFIDELLEGTDTDLTDIEIVKLAPADTLIALENGAVDGAWLIDPLQNQVADNPDFVFLGGAPEGTVGGGLFFGDELLDPENKDVAEAFIRAMARTTELYLQPGYHENDQVVADLARIGEVPEDSIVGAEEPRFELRITDGLVGEMQKSWFKQDVLEYDEPLTDDEVVNSSFVNAVLGDG